MQPSILSHKELFLDRVTEKLAAVPLDYAAKLRSIKAKGASADPHLAAGVLLLLYYRADAAGKNNEGNFFFRLIKRSRRVPQAGDLACPGGMLKPRRDRPAAALMKNGILPFLRNRAGYYVRRRGRQESGVIALFLANALREAWEELRLNPFRFHFLGPLPPHDLHLFPRTIFPLAGYVEGNPRLHFNAEVERLVNIPLEVFFREENYGRLREKGPLVASENEPELKPCLFYRDAKGRESILWGATFAVVTNFLRLVFDFQVPSSPAGPVFDKTIDTPYLSGLPRRCNRKSNIQ